MQKLKVMSVFGTRPEAVKMAPLVTKMRGCPKIESIVCVTAQHRQMLDQVLDIFGIVPDFDLNIMQERQTLQGVTTKVLSGLEEVFSRVTPDLILVHGDTTTSFAAALAAFYERIPIGHVEAGLRTYNKYEPYPEEINRCLTGVLADLHFAPTSFAKNCLTAEGIVEDKIFITGNTVIDAMETTVSDDYVFSVDELNKIDYKNKKIITMTAHRRENLGEPLENVFNAVKRIAEDNSDVEIVYAVHFNPVVREPAFRILSGYRNIHLVEPLDLRDMHNLMKRSCFIMTDSGGLQEESASLKKPVMVLRNVTERPEGVTAGVLKLVGTDEKVVYNTAMELLKLGVSYKKMAEAKNPYGDGRASERIIEAVLFSFGLGKRPEDYIVI